MQDYLLLHFNSHPHEEDDKDADWFEADENISTHILTKRMTILNIPQASYSNISTHILTKRMTWDDEEDDWEE